MKVLKIISIHPGSKQLRLQDQRGVIWFKTMKSVAPFKIGMKLELKGMGY